MNKQNRAKPHLDIEQIKKLRDALRGHELEAIITLAIVTGMRRDELLHLKWQDVDLDRRNLSVQNTKTKNSESIHIPEDVNALLNQHRLRQPEGQIPTDLVFPDQTGEKLNPHQLVTGFHEILEQAGLPRISFHDLRATAKKKELAAFKEDNRHG